MAGDRTRKKHGHYLAGTAHCGQCGKRLMFTKCTGRNGRKFDYLVCPGRRKIEKSCDLPYQPVDRVEDIVVRYYESHVSVDAERVAVLMPNLIEQYKRVANSRTVDVDAIRKIIDAIRAKQKQLVDSHLAIPRAVPLDLLEVKQGELDEELKAADAQLASAMGDVETGGQGMQRASRLLTALPSTYRAAKPLFRRQINQAYFLKVFIGRRGVTGAVLTPEYEAVTRDGLAARLQELSDTDEIESGRVSTREEVVELAGFEPATSWVRSASAILSVGAKSALLPACFPWRL